MMSRVLGTACALVCAPNTSVLFLSRATHLPARRVTYAGDTVVEVEEFSDLNAAANLKESDI